MPTRESNLADFANARLGLFIHFGLYSMVGRGEWVLNKEHIPLSEYRQLADRFDPVNFDADDIARRAKAAGMRYLCFTTMHHEGFCLYESKINPFNSVSHGCGRDLVQEVVDACRKHDLRVHLYHSLNHWTCNPDGVDALEDPAAQKQFVDFAHARIEELVQKFNPIDCLWYDGWWPFNAEGWRAQEMNAMALRHQPHLIFNGRNGLPGDFATPEGHLSAPYPWQPWEACMTQNDNWGFHAGDHHWKDIHTVVGMLTTCAAGAGNLLINIGPDGTGAIPQPSLDMLDGLADWNARHAEAIYDTQPLTMELMDRRPDDRGDWSHSGKFTVKGNTLYVHLFNWPGQSFSISHLECQAKSCKLITTGQDITFTQDGGRVTFTGLPDSPPHPVGGVLALECDSPPSIYNCGGLRIPKVDHPRYDPCPSDIMH